MNPHVSFVHILSSTIEIFSWYLPKMTYKYMPLTFTVSQKALRGKKLTFTVARDLDTSVSVTFLWFNQNFFSLYISKLTEEYLLNNY